MLIPYDLGSLLVLENCSRIKIGELYKATKKDLKMTLLQAHIEVLGLKVAVTTSKTQFNGVRLWFTCPICQRRVGVLYKQPLIEAICCRSCSSLKYRKQRFKGMVESSAF